MLELFTPSDKLFAALRRRAPQIACAVGRDGCTGLSHVRVTYRHVGPYKVEWSGRTYQWQPGFVDAALLPAAPEAAADAIADALGAARPATSP